MTDTPILIAGGGIGGFAAALALSQKGRAVHLIEQAPEFGEVGAGIQIGPNVFKMFDVLGVTEAINEVAVFPKNLVMKDALTGRDITRMPVGGEAFLARYKYPYGVIYRPDLHNTLIDACKGSDLIELTVGQGVVGFEDTGEGVRVETSTGDTYEGAALIGADGLWSKDRERLVGGQCRPVGRAEDTSGALSAPQGRDLQSRRRLPQRPLRGGLGRLRRRGGAQQALRRRA